MLVGISGFWDDWELRAKVTFDGPNRLIIINPNVTELDFRTDVYTEWKQWVKVYDHMKYEQAITVVGGDPISQTVSLGATFFLVNGWKMRTWEGDHRLTVSGNVYADDGTSQFVGTIGNWNITINLKVSNLIDEVQVSGSNGDIASIAGSAVAADALRLQYDGTGLNGDTYPASQSQVSALPISTAAAVWTVPVLDNLIPNSMGEAIAIIRGLSQCNFVVDQSEYNSRGLLVASRLRVFKSKDDAIAGIDPIATFNMVNTPKPVPSNHLTDQYTVTKG